MSSKKKVGRPKTGTLAYLDNVPKFDVYDPHSGGLKEKQILNGIKTPVRLGICSDFFSLGIFCQKTNLVEYAEKNLKRVNRRDTGQSRQFYQGVRDADEYTFTDIAMEMLEIRQYTTWLFDSFIKHRSGAEVLKQVKEAIAYAEDNPWPSLNQIECNGRKHSKSIFINGIGQPNARKYAHYNKPPAEEMA